MAIKGMLTNERLNKRFNNSFELVAYAIQLAERMINAGHSMEDVESEILNPAFFILQEIADGRDVLESILPETEEEEGQKEPEEAVQKEEPASQ